MSFQYSHDSNPIFMRIARFTYLALASTFLLLAPQAHAQELVIRLRRAGDTTQVIRNATVTIDHSIELGNTDATGTVRLDDLEYGGHIIEVVAKGYQAFFDQFKSGPTIPQPIVFDLLPVLASDTAKAKGQPTELKLAGFDKRRAAAQGKFFTKAQLDASAGRPLANLLKSAGANIVAGPKGGSLLALGGAPRPAGPCYATVVRDGGRIYPFGSAAPVDLDKFFAEQFASIELYMLPAQVPAELKDAATCGALVLWSR